MIYGIHKDPPPLSIIINDSFITYIVSRSRFSDVLIRTLNFVVFRDKVSFFQLLLSETE